MGGSLSSSTAGASPVIAEHEVLVDFAALALQLVSPVPLDGAAIEPVINGEVPPGLMGASAGGVFLHSGGRRHYPAIRTEIWPAEPPPDQGRISAEVEDQIVIRVPPDAILHVVTMEERSDQPLHLKRGGKYIVRASVWGHDAAVQRGDEGYFRGVEHWRIQIWPIDS